MIGVKNIFVGKKVVPPFIISHVIKIHPENTGFQKMSEVLLFNLAHTKNTHFKQTFLGINTSYLNVGMLSVLIEENKTRGLEVASNIKSNPIAH